MKNLRKIPRSIFNRSIWLLLMLFIFIQPTNATIFKIYVLKGEAKWIYNSNTTTTYKVTSGFYSKENSKLIIMKSGSCILFPADMKSYIEIRADKENKAINIDSLALVWDKSSVKISKSLIKYSDFLKDIALTATNEINQSQYLCMKRYGHESRCPPNIRFLRPYGSETYNVYGDELYFQWLEDSSVSNCIYTVYAKNMFDEPLFNDPTAEKSYRMDMSKISGGENIVIFGVTYPCVCCNQADELFLKIITGLEKEEISKLRMEITTPDYWQMLMEAMIYEDKKLYLDAFTQYKKVQQKFPDYKNTYFFLAQFMERNRISYPCSSKPLYFGN